jgi:AraC-like DNA-binding protein/quercetin dioxygenase-like cupin family protein
VSEKVKDGVAFNRFEEIGTPSLLKSGVLINKQARNPVRRSTPNYLFHYITSGSGWVQFQNASVIKLKRGDWFYCFPGQEIMYRQEENDPWLYRWVQFKGADLHLLLKSMTIEKDTYFRSNTYDEKIEKYFEEIRLKLASGEKVQSLLATARLLELFSYLMSQVEYKNKARYSKGCPKHAAIEKAMRFMDEHFVEGIQINQVINYTGYDRSYFSKVFSEQIGFSLKEYLALLREKKAKELLMDTRLSVGSVAQSIGFSESKTFSRFFTARTGYSPRGWQKKIMNG